MVSSDEDRSRLRWTAASVLALALHGLAIGLVHVSCDTEPAPAEERSSRAEPMEIEVGLAAEEQAPPPGVVVPVPPARAERAQSASLGNLKRGDTARSAPSATAGEAPPEGVEPQAPSAPERHIDLGIGDGDWSRWVRPADVAQAPAAPERSASEPAPVSRTGGLAEALEAHDLAVGIGPAGAVLAAARDAAHSDIAPQLGRATFAVTLSSTGLVQVELASANGSADAWRAVGASMQAALARKPPSIPASRSRVQWKLEVVAEERWPNGAKPRDAGTGVVVAPPKFQAVDEAKEDLARRNPLATDPVPAPGVDRPPLRLQAQPPGVFVEHHGKVCNVAVGLTPFGLGILGGCDPSNIGAKPVRVVATRILSETAL